MISLNIKSAFDNFIESQRSELWGYDPTLLPEGTIAHPNSTYTDVCAVWVDPNTGEPVSEFNIITTGKYYTADLRSKSSNLPSKSSRMRVVNELKRGFVFEDDDEGNMMNAISSGKGANKAFGNCTHLIQPQRSRGINIRPIYYDTNNLLVFSKTIDGYNRLTYTVKRPSLVNGKYRCDVELNNFIGHRFNGKPYAYA